MSIKKTDKKYAKKNTILVFSLLAQNGVQAPHISPILYFKKVLSIPNY